MRHLFLASLPWALLFSFVLWATIGVAPRELEIPVIPTLLIGIPCIFVGTMLCILVAVNLNHAWVSWLSRRPVLVRRMDKATKAIDELLRLLIGVGVLALSVVLVTQIVYQIAVSPFDSADRTFAKKGLRHWKEVACGAAIFVVSVGTICAMIAGAWKNRNTKEES